MATHSTFDFCVQDWSTGPPSLSNIAFSDNWSVYYKVLFLYKANRNLSGLRIPVESNHTISSRKTLVHQTDPMNIEQLTFQRFPSLRIEKTVEISQGLVIGVALTGFREDETPHVAKPSYSVFSSEQQILYLFMRKNP